MRTMNVMFRFPVKQTNDFTVEVRIPTGPMGVDMFNEAFVELFSLSDEEVEAAEARVLRQIAILPASFSESQAAHLHKRTHDRAAEAVSRGWSVEQAKKVTVVPANDKR